MNLEDHAGDVVRKARLSVNATPEAAAQAAGLSIAELSDFESNGTLSKAINYAALGKLVQLDAGKLEGLVKGWQPTPPDLGQWREIRQITTESEGMTVNAYLVWDEVNLEAALFDTGFDAAPIFALIEENNLQLKHIFLTHGHSDHVAGLGAIREKFPKVRMHSDLKGTPPEHRNRRNDFIMLGSLRISNRETPGHSEDGVTYVIGNFPEDGPFAAIVGDAIFAGSMGRGNQSWDLAKQKVRESIFNLPTETLLCPGHGPLTTIAQEKAFNPFF